MRRVVTDDVLKRRRDAAVQTGGSQDSTAHTPALLRIQGHLGLDNPLPHFLHGDNGAVQRRLQEQDQRGCISPGGRHHCRRHILHRHRPQLPYDFRRRRRRSRL